MTSFSSSIPRSPPVASRRAFLSLNDPRPGSEMLDRLGASDRVRLVLAASTPHWLDDNPSGQPARDRRIGERLAALKPTLATADMPACVHAALSSETASDTTSRLIVIVTDGAAHGSRRRIRSAMAGH